MSIDYTRALQTCFYPDENRNSVRRESKNMSPGLQTNIDQKSTSLHLFLFQKWIKMTREHRLSRALQTLNF